LKSWLKMVRAGEGGGGEGEVATLPLSPHENTKGRAHDAARNSRRVGVGIVIDIRAGSIILGDEL
jgi:hypothetical protein